MKKRFSVLLILLLSVAGFAQRKGPFTLNSTTGPNSCATINVNSQTSSTVGISVTGTWSATLTPQVQIAGQTATDTAVYPYGSTTSQATITGNGTYNSPVAGADTFQICVTAHTSGDAIVYLTVSTGVAKIGGGGGAGTNNPGGSPGQIQTNGGAVFGAFTASGDATINTTTGVVTVSGVKGAAVPASKTIVGTNASAQIVDASTATLANNTTGTASNLSGTPALPNGTTATTQTVGDNTTKIATDAFVLANVGSGAVNSVGLTVNGTSPSGIFTVTGSPVTTTGSLNFNLAGTSGGIPYFSSGTVLSSSAALPAGDFVLGGGAGAAPTATFSVVPLNKGGTAVAAATAADAFNALAPATATGGLIVGTGVNTYGNVAVGSSGQCLIVSAGTWAPGSCATGAIGGAGTSNTLAKFTAAATIGNSTITDDGTTVTSTATGGLNLTAGPIELAEIAAPAGATAHSFIYATNAHRLLVNNNNGTPAQLVQSGADINTSDQVTVTHLASALPVNQGGTGTTSTLTGIMRGSASAMTAAELSGDVTTSGSNAVTVVALRNAALPTLAASTGLFYDTSGTLSLQATLPTAAVPAFTGDMTNSAGSLATTVAKINGTAFSGTTGHLVSFASATTPGDSGVVGADVITYHTPATGIARTTSASQAIVGSELSGDATTSGSNAVTVVKINGNSVPSGAAAHQTLVATALSTLAWKTITNCDTSVNVAAALNYSQSTDLFSCNTIATLSNPMTTLGDMIDGGASGVVTRLAGPTSGNSPYILTSLPSGGIATTPTWAVMGVPVDSESGATFTIQSDAQTTPDRGKVVNLTNNTTSTAVTLPQAGSAGMLSNIPFVIMNSGSVVATVTPTTSTVNGDTAFKLLGTVSGHTPSAAFVWSDALSTTGNYWAAEFLPTDANGRLGCEGFMALTGDVTNTAGNCATTVGKVNGGAIPTSAGTVGTNSSGQFVAASGLTMNSSGGGAASGTVYTGASAVTISWNTIGAAPATASTTVNGQTCTLGSACTIPEEVNNSTISSQIGWNFLTSVTNAVGLTVTPINVSTNEIFWEITGSALTLGTDASVPGTVQLSKGAAGGAHTIFGSAATTTNTILGFATAPTTGDLISCTTSSTTCTLTDAGVLAANVVTAVSNYSNGGLVYSNGTTKTTANSADWAMGGSGNHTLVGGSAALLDMSAATTAGGLLIPAASYKASAGTGTAGHLACYTSSSTLGNCTGTPSNNFLGVFTTTTAWAASGEVTVTLDATVNVTFGDILCASSTSAGTAHDNGSTPCTNGEWVGVVKTTAATTATATAFLKMQ